MGWSTLCSAVEQPTAFSARCSMRTLADMRRAAVIIRDRPLTSGLPTTVPSGASGSGDALINVNADTGPTLGGNNQALGSLLGGGDGIGDLGRRSLGKAC